MNGSRAPELIIVGDEAWTVEEWEKEQRQRESRRAWEREYRKSPAQKERIVAYLREWRRKRAAMGLRSFPKLVGSLHSLACTGPTKSRGCVCAAKGIKKIRMYDKPVPK